MTLPPNECERNKTKARIADLTPHPLQGKFFSVDSEFARKQLAADIEKNGLREPITILPNNTIILGHRRVAACKSLGWNEIDAFIRDDLADDSEAAEMLFIQDNLNRRQLSCIGQARCAKHLMQIAREGELAGYGGRRRPVHTRDYVGKMLGMNGRTLQRLIKVLEAPEEVQQALEAGHISRGQAEQVAGLRDRKTRAQIAEEIRSLGLKDAREAINKHLPAKEKKPRTPNKAFATLMRDVGQAAIELDGKVEQLRHLDAEDVEKLEQGIRLLRKLRDHGKDLAGDLTQ